MYSELYPSLYKAFPFQNFEVLVETLEKQFGQLFHFPLIEQELSKGHLSGSYIQFFSHIFNELQAKPSNDLYTVEQISTKVYQILHTNPQVRQSFLSALIFLPPLNGEVSNQIGFQEKLATGRLKVPESVTYLDMLRITHFLNLRGRGGNKGVTVVSRCREIGV